MLRCILSFDLEIYMILYYVYFVVLQRFTSFAVSAIQALKDCTDNQYLVRQLFLEVFLKENISMFSQFCFTTLIIICILIFMEDLKSTCKLITHILLQLISQKPDYPRFSTQHFFHVLISPNYCKIKESIGGHHSDSILEF